MIRLFVRWSVICCGFNPSMLFVAEDDFFAR